MASVGNKTEDPPQICRLCLSEESLNDVFEEEDLHQLISDYLSITISVRDRMSQSLCVICKIRLNEFHQFRINCQEAQIVQQSMIKDRDIAVEEANLENHTQEIKRSPLHLESCFEELPDGTTQEVKRGKYTIFDHREEEDQQSLSLENIVDIQNVKVEANADNDLELTAQSSSDLEQTVQEQADVTTQKSYECGTCHKVFLCRKTLCYHKKREHDTQNYNCSLCGVGFVFQCHLTLHLRSKQHADRLNPPQIADDPSKPYKCEICHKGFKMASRLKNHKTAVHEQKLHACPICDLIFGDNSGMKRHLKDHYRGNVGALQLEQGPVPKKVQQTAVDTDKSDRPFKCDLCPKTFKENRRLTWHRKQVHGPKVYCCGLCDFKCYSRFNLGRHEQIHARESAKAAHKKTLTSGAAHKKNIGKQEDTIP